MTPEAEQLMNNPGEFIGNAANDSIINAAKFLVPFFAPLVLLVIVSSLAFTQKKINPIIRTILIILSLLILAWMLYPHLAH